MSTIEKPIPIAELSALSRAGSASTGYSPLSSRNCLLFEEGGRPLSATDAKRVAHWLRQLPCPTIGIFGKRGNDVIRKACDVVLAEPGQAEPLVANIGRSPIAAAVLVQLLRTTEDLPIPEALVAESLAYSTLQAGPEFQRWLKDNRAAQPARSTDTGPAVVMERDDDQLSLELNRSSTRNALSVEMRDALNEALQLVLADSSIRRVRVTGRGKCFSVGGDLSEFGSLPDPATAHVIRSLTMPGRLLAQCAKRVEFHVHGACIGSGVELPAFARRVTAATDSFFHMPELRLGLLPGGGGCVSIPRRIGRQRTAWLVLSGKRINAKQALAWGLVDAVAQ